MRWLSEPAHADSPATVSRKDGIRLLTLFLVTGAIAATLVGLGQLPAGQAIGIPLAAVGLALLFLNSHWALCFAAFAITPFGVVQREVLGVTFNLPEVLILGLFAKEGLRFLRHRESPSPLAPWKSLLAFGAVMVLAIGTGLYHQNVTLKVLQDFRQFVEFVVLFLYVIHRVSTREQVIQIGVAYVLGATLVAIHGIIQHFIPIGISEIQIASDLVLHRGVRSGSFYGATPLGGLMVLAVGPAIGIILATEKRGLKGVLLVCIALCLLALIYTKTRGSWVGMLLALGFLFYWVRPGKKGSIAVGVAVLLVALVAGPMVLSRLSTFSNPEEDRSLMERAKYYAAAVMIAKAHPLLGLGWGCYYEIDTILEEDTYLPIPRPEDAEDATVHSAYLQIFVKTGAIGLVAFLALVVAWLERLWRVYHARPENKQDVALFAGIAAGLMGYLFHSTFENFFQWPVMAQSFWLLLGLSFITAAWLGGKKVYRKIPLAFVSAGVVAFLIFMAVCMRFESLHTDLYVKNVAKAIEEGDLEKALRIARRATQTQVGDYYTHVVYAKTLLLAGDPDRARNHLDRAMVFRIANETTSRRVNTDLPYYYAEARLVRGQYLFEQGDLRSALAQFELARAYADLGDEEFVPYHEVLHAAYTEIGWTARAAAFAPEEGRAEPNGMTFPESPYLHALERHAAGDHAAALTLLDKVPADSPYAPLARAHALSLDAAPERHSKLLAALQEMAWLPRSEGATLRPAAWQAADGAEPGAPVPLSLVWAVNRAALAQITGVTPLTSTAESAQYRLEGTDGILQFQWAVPGTISPTALPESDVAGPTPGWIDGGHEWFEVRPAFSALRSEVDGHTAWRVPGLNWVYSVPTALESFDGALVTSTLAAPSGHARLEWQIMDETSEVLEQDTLLESSAPQPDSKTYYIPSDPSSGHLRLHLEVSRQGVAALGDVQILKLRSPYPRVTGHDGAQP